MFKVILVDDEPEVLQYLPEMFNREDMSFEITGKFTRAEQALLYVKDNEVDVAVVDISMPDIDGIEFARICYEQYPDIFIVLFSAYKEFEYARKAIDYDVFAYVTKPISYDEFNSVLKNLHAKLMTKFNEKEGTDPFKNEGSIVDMCVDYMEKHYAEPIGLKDIAKEVAHNPTYLSTKYKQLSGENIIETLNKIRIEHAKQLLQQNHKSYNVHTQVGYNSYAYFYKVFKELCGMIPSEYKKKYENSDK